MHDSTRTNNRRGDRLGDCIAKTAGLEIHNDSGVAVNVTLANAGFLGHDVNFELAKDGVDHRVVPSGQTAISVFEESGDNTPIGTTTFDLACGKTHVYTIPPLPQVELAIELQGVGYGNVVSTPPGVDCSNDGRGSTCAALFPQGSKVTLAITPDPGTTLSNPPDESATYTLGVGLLLPVTFQMTAPSLSVATFGNGTILSSPAGIECSTTPNGRCEGYYVNGSDVTLVPSAGVGSTFEGFAGDCSGPSCTVHIDGNPHHVNATFAQTQETLTITKSGTGTGSVTVVPGTGTGFTCGATCTGTFPHGTYVSITATPDSGSSFAGWSGGCLADPTYATCSVQLTGSTTIDAGFASP